MDWNDLTEGDEVFYGFTSHSGSEPAAGVFRGTVVSAADRLVRAAHSGRITVVHEWEVAGRTEAEVWAACADELHSEAVKLIAKAVECRKKALPQEAVTV